MLLLTLSLVVLPLTLVVLVTSFLAGAVPGCPGSWPKCRRERRTVVARRVGVLCVVAYAAAIPWIAKRIAETSTDWVDADDNGMLDPFVNGAYDWVDINAGAWLVAAAVLAAATAGALSVILATLRSRELSER